MTKPSHQSERIVIVGGGFAGLAIAARLCQAGLPVTLLDESQLGSEASTRNQGWLHSGAVFAPDDLALARLCRESLEQTLRFCPDCLEGQHDGMAYVASKAETLSRPWTEAWEQAEIPFRELPLSELADQLPPLQTSQVCRAFHLPDRAIRPDVLLQRLAATARNAGAEIRTGSPVTSLSRGDDGVTGVVTTADEEVRGRLVILATGARGAPFWPQILPAEPGSQPEHCLVALKTHLVAVHPPVGIFPLCVIDRGGFNHLPHAATSVFGSNRWTIAKSADDRSVEPAEIDRIWQNISHFFPELNREEHETAAWSGTAVQAMHAEQVEPGKLPLPTVIDHSTQSPPIENLISVYPGRATLWAYLAEKTREVVLEKLGARTIETAAPPWAE